jgi:hypothetical protein
VEWTLPNDGKPEMELLGQLFTLIRHGQAHQGMQTMATLSDGGTFGVSLSGVAKKTITAVKAAPRSKWHLRVNSLHASETWIQISPEVLYLDVRGAIDAANLVHCGLRLSYLTQAYRFDTQALRAALKSGGLRTVNGAP